MFGKKKPKPPGYDLAALRAHPGANPEHSFPTGRARWVIGEFKRRNGSTFRLITVRDRSRWLPHNGPRQMARRVRQMEARRR